MIMKCINKFIDINLFITSHIYTICIHIYVFLPYNSYHLGIQINHRPDWKEGKGDQSHMAWFFDNADLSLCGIHMPETAASAVITFVGPASVVFFTFETPIGTIILFQTHIL